MDPTDVIMLAKISGDDQVYLAGFVILMVAFISVGLLALLDKFSKGERCKRCGSKWVVHRSGDLICPRCG